MGFSPPDEATFHLQDAIEPGMTALMCPRTWGQWLWPLLVVLFSPSFVYAYNFLYTHPDTGEPIGWEAGTTIEYWVDPGPLGRLSNEQALTLVQEAMKIWENASPLADVPQFEFAGFLPEDVDGTNYTEYATIFPCYTDLIDECDTQTQRELITIIIFDDSDEITDNLCNLGGCSAITIGGVFEGSRDNPHAIIQSMLVLGQIVGDADTRINATLGIMVHEFGHLLGLAHSSLNQQDDLDSLSMPVQPHLRPTMYWRSNWPEIFSDANSATLHSDDMAGIGLLYPTDRFLESTSGITGEILKANGEPLMHINVIARDVNDPLCSAYSILSGRYCTHSKITDRCLEDNGGYFFSGLPPATYTLEVEEILNTRAALAITPGLTDAFLTGDAEFWNNDDQANEDRLESTLITVLAGETITGLDIILSASEVADDRIPFIDLNIFEMGPETSCPIAPEIDYATLIGIDESPQTSQTPSSAGGCSLIH